MIFIIMIWFVLTGNTEMSIFMKKVNQTKGKSKHLDKRRWLSHNSLLKVHPDLIPRHSKKNRQKLRPSRANNEIYMPYRIFEDGNKYKRLKPKHIKIHKYGVTHAMAIPGAVFRRSRLKAPVKEQIRFDHGNSINKSRASNIENSERKNKGSDFNNLVFQNNLKSSTTGKNIFTFEQVKGDINDGNHEAYLSGERKAFSSRSRSNNFVEWNVKFITPFNDFNKPTLLRNVPKTPKVAQAKRGSNYLAAPFAQLFKREPPESFSTPETDMSIFNSKTSSESSRLFTHEYEQPVTNVLTSYLVPQILSEPRVRNNIIIEDFPRDLSQASAVRQLINKPKILSLPPYLQFSKAKSDQESSIPMKDNFVSTSEIPPKNTLLPEYEQLPRNTFVSNTKLVSYFGNKNASEYRFLNVSRDEMHSQSTKNPQLSSTTVIGMASSEMSSLQYFHHKLKQMKDIHDRISNEKVLILSIVAILAIAIFILVSGLLYRRYDYKKRTSYPSRKRNALTLLRSGRPEQRKLLRRIGNLKYESIMEEE